MSKTNRRAIAAIRPKTPPSSPTRRSPVDRTLARSALLARKVLASALDDEEDALPQPSQGAFAGSLLLH